MSDTLSNLKWRYATKQFDPQKKISDADFQTLLDALVLTPSSYGLQPWKFVVVENPEIRKTLIEHSWGQPQVAEASHLIVLCRPEKIDEAYVEHYIQTVAEKRKPHPDKNHDHEITALLSNLEKYKGLMVENVVKGMSPAAQQEWMEKQVYIALGNLMTVAATMQIDSCPMEGFAAEQYDEILGLKEQGLHSVVLCPVGYRLTGDKYAQMAKVRFDASELILKI